MDFQSRRLKAMEAYTPGEQPKNKQYIKLNTNEFPYPPSPKVRAVIESYNKGELRLYPDPAAQDLKLSIADFHGVRQEQVFVGNGSDEVLAMAFLAFFDMGDRVCYPNYTYGFYKVFADLFELKSEVIPLKEDFSADTGDYQSLSGNLFLANPNAPTGIALKTDEIEGILKANPERLVIIDEAYADFAKENCLPLLSGYQNLLVVRTMSKSRALAGMRIGYAVGSRELVSALEKAKYSFNPYNINRLSQACGIAAMEDTDYFETTCQSVTTTREWTKRELKALGFDVLPSEANFVFAKHKRFGGEKLYKALMEKGILVRHFNTPGIEDYIRISIGLPEQMKRLFETAGEIIG